MCFCFSELLIFIEVDDPYTWKGIMMAVCMFITQIMLLLLKHNNTQYATTAGLKLRSVLNATIYRKVSRRGYCNAICMNTIVS